MKKNVHILRPTEKEEFLRLDKFLVQRFSSYTRNYFQKLLREGCIVIKGQKVRAGLKIRLQDEIEVVFPEPKNLTLESKKIPLSIVFENKDIIVIHKPSGMVVHPGVGETHFDDSLVNAILYHCKESLSGIGGILRPGIVHRLDKNTSGLLVVAKNDQAHQYLSNQFQARTVEKMYYALLAGHLEPHKGSIDAPLGRDRRQRKKISVLLSGRAALTHYEVAAYYKENQQDYTLVKIRLHTGRTHQIRVHFAAIGYPLVGDDLYGNAKINKYFQQHFQLERQFLHAFRLAFALPESGEKVVFEANLSEDLQKTLQKLKKSEETEIML